MFGINTQTIKIAADGVEALDLPHGKYRYGLEVAGRAVTTRRSSSPTTTPGT
jgi:hypothetical protein